MTSLPGVTVIFIFQPEEGHMVENLLKLNYLKPLFGLFISFFIGFEVGKDTLQFFWRAVSWSCSHVLYCN